MIDSAKRTEISRAVAKAIAYKNCGNEQMADGWARHVVALMECHGIMGDSDRQMYQQHRDNRAFD